MSFGRNARLMLTFAISGLLSFSLETHVALAGHETDSCAPLDQFNKEQQAVTERSSVTEAANNLGNKADIRVVVPNPSPSTAIVRSIYIIRDDDDLLEFGWMWDAANVFGGGTDSHPTVFLAWRTQGHGGLHFYKGTGNSAPGWKTFDSDSEHLFNIANNQGDANDHRWRFWRDGNFTDTVENPNITSGFVAAGLEALAKCDTVFGHFSHMQKCAPSVQGCSYQSWNATTIMNNGFRNSTKWFHYDEITNGQEFWELHCDTAHC